MNDAPLMTAEGLAKSYGARKLFEGISFGIDEGARVGVVGANGAGKSTLLGIIAGRIAPDAGRVALRNGARAHYLAQQPEIEPGESALLACLRSDSAPLRAARRWLELSQALVRDPQDAALSEQMARATDAVEREGAWDLEGRARAALAAVGIEEAERPVDRMSGGQKRRVAIARATLEPCDLLILDEPTNHLDLHASAWLERALRERAGAILMVTHDRYLLERVCDQILEIDRGEVFMHPGNFSAMLERRALRDQGALRGEERRRNAARRELEWLRRGPKARTSKSKVRVERARALQESEYAERQGVGIEAGSRRLGKKVVAAHGARIERDGRLLIDDLDLAIGPGARLGLIGPNGAGKTTLLRALTGEYPLFGGELEVGETVRFGIFRQEAEDLDEGMRVLEAVEQVARGIETEGGPISAAELLESLLFDRARLGEPIGRLSGGERRRVQLARVLLGRPNVLILDEPTNDLDVDTLAALEAFLADFAGAIVLVSHDRATLDAICVETLALDGDGGWSIFDGAATEWLEREEKRREEEREVERRARAEAEGARRTAEEERRRAERAAAGGLTGREERELARLEAEIERLEAEIERLEAEMIERATDHEAARSLAARAASLGHALDEAMKAWENLASRA